jgi:hypothetical protein
MAALIPARIRLPMLAMMIGGVFLVLFVIPAGGADNPLPWLAAIGMAGFGLGLGVAVLASVARRLSFVGSKANG